MKDSQSGAPIVQGTAVVLALHWNRQLKREYLPYVDVYKR